MDKYFVEDHCILCEACFIEAPKNFALDEKKSLAYVNKNPENDKELEDCENALATCPVEAIKRESNA